MTSYCIIARLQSIVQASHGTCPLSTSWTTWTFKGMWCMKTSSNCCAGGGDPAKELVVVSNVAMNPLAFVNDPTAGSFIIFKQSHKCSLYGQGAGYCFQ